MKAIAIRLFITMPLYILVFILISTLVIPLVYWIVTGEDFAHDSFKRINTHKNVAIK